MHLLTIIAFAVLIYEADTPGQWCLVGSGDRFWTWAVVLGGAGVLVLAAWAVSRWGLGRLGRAGANADRVHQALGRAGFGLRVLTTLWFAAAVLLTNWTRVLDWGAIHPWLKIADDLAALIPYLLVSVLLWFLTFPLESALRDHEFALEGVGGEGRIGRLRLSAYLDFNIRHHLLVVAVPMSAILMAADVIRVYEDGLARVLGFPWVGDILLGVVAAGMFLVAPLVLARVWRTEPLPEGPLRRRLDGVCERISLRCRDILIWKSDGAMINAAVMGLFPSVRYVMLSDALLETMSDRQVEAVFGHEAGHICRGHIQRFLVFAFVAWLLVAALMEGMALLAIRWGQTTGDVISMIQGAGVALTMLFWGVGFGMLSRRFERQADLFGARCVAGNGDVCAVPCSVHLKPTSVASLAGPGVAATPHGEDRVCAMGADVFVSALDRVAVLNGIPHEERSWRHSSIGSRIRFLTTLAGDPASAERFERSLRRINSVLLSVALMGAVAVIVYWFLVSMPAILRLQAGQVGAGAV